MGIYKLANDLKILSVNTPTCNMASFGDISLYDNKSTIAYPYVNIDVVSSNVVNNALKTFTMRFYVCDRNEPYVAYNKCELIMDSIMSQLSIPNYSVNYFNLDFQDVVNGIYADVNFDDKINLSCLVNPSDESYVVLENGDLVNSKYIGIEESDGDILTEENN